MTPMLVALLSALALSAPAAEAVDVAARAAAFGERAREHGMAGRWAQSVTASLKAAELEPAKISHLTDLAYTLTLLQQQPVQAQQAVSTLLLGATTGQRPPPASPQAPTRSPLALADKCLTRDSIRIAQAPRLVGWSLIYPTWARSMHPVCRPSCARSPWPRRRWSWPVPPRPT